VLSVTEGGETSSVIGTIMAALRQYGEDPTGASDKLYFIYNNPSEVLMPFERSRMVIDNPHITKIQLWTGPQSIGGSTRMQASTSEQFVISILLEEALIRSLQRVLNPAEMEQMGFSEVIVKLSLQDRLSSFLAIQASVAAAAKDVSRFTDLEATIYAEKKHSFYFA
jgi:N-acetylmuramic acid 6-phosphate etherase